MNSLSWFLYLAGIANSVGGALFILCLITAIVIVILNITGNVHGYEHTIDHEFKIFAKPYIIAFVVLVAMISLIPSKDTLYMIAGSEIGEVVITNPENQIVFDKVRELVNTRLDAAIGETEK